MALYLPGPALAWSFVCCNFTHCLFIQYLNPEISKLQSPDRVFSTVICSYFRTIIDVKNTVYFRFCGLWQTPTSQIIYKYPSYRSFLDLREILWDLTSHVIKCLQMQYKTLPNKLHTFQYNSLFFFYGFTSCAHFLVVSSQIFWCKVVFTLTNYILKHKNDALKNRKLYIC